MIIRLLASLVIVLCLSGAANADDATFEEAMSLFSDGNYVEAKPIADAFAAKDDPRAFMMLGTMSQKGLGVEVDAPLGADGGFLPSAHVRRPRLRFWLAL